MRCRCRASRSDIYRRSHCSTPQARSSKRSKPGSVNRYKQRKSSKRFTPLTRSPTPISITWPLSKRSTKPFSRPRGRTPSIKWRSRPTRCVCRPGTPCSAHCPAAKSAASRCASCCCRSLTCCCLTSRPTIWMPRASTGSSSSCCVFRARWSRSRTIATFSTMRPNGFSSSIAVAGFPIKATTARGFSRKKNVSSASRSRKTRA